MCLRTKESSMFASFHGPVAMRSVLAAAALASLALAATARAPSIAIDEMTALADWQLDGNVPEALEAKDSGPAAAVNVLRFPFDIGSGAGLHSYGSSGGALGSRSSGFGVFDVTGSLSVKLTVTNDLSTAHNAVFDFHVSPGLLELTELPYGGNQFAEAGIAFELRASNGKSFSSAAVLRNDAGGLSFNSSGDTSLYGGSGAHHFVQGVDRTLDLGVLGAGESVTLSYTLSSYAKGNTEVTETTAVPGRTVVVPGHWVSGCPAQGDAVDEVPAQPACSSPPVFVPTREVTLPDSTYNEGDAGAAQASSGDPFAFNAGADPLALPPERNGKAFGLTLTATEPPNEVPEPGALSLVLLALGAAGAAMRRRAN
jgi:hypothetical protein